MNLKEKTWGNYSIPYVRYYRDGDLVNESNFVSRRGFLKRFDVLGVLL